MFFEGLLRVRYCFKRFLYVVYFNFYYIMKKVLVLIYRKVRFEEIKFLSGRVMIEFG